MSHGKDNKFERLKWTMLVLLSLCTIAFIALAIAVQHNSPIKIDMQFTGEVQEQSSVAWDYIMRALSVFGRNRSVVFIALAAAFIFYRKGYKREALFLLIAPLGSVLSLGVKAMVSRPRPGAEVLQVISDGARQSGFPSGHFVHYVAFFGFLIVIMNNLPDISKAVKYSVNIVCSFLILVIPFSRVYLGGHWFTDVVGGYLFGTICLIVLSWFYLKKPHKTKEGKL